MTVDSHHHLWRYDRAEFGWITNRMRKLRRNFLPRDFKPVARAAGVGGAVAVQARQTLAETRFLLECARSDPFFLGVVGWVPLAGPGVADALAGFAGEPKLKACRHVLQDEPDDGYMLRPDFNAGVRALTAAGLAYDVLVFERHLQQTLEFVDRHPDQVFVLDHVGKPRIRDGSFDAWRARIGELARRPRVYCKVSGMVTEADWGAWTEGQLRRYLDAVAEAFGPERMMFGSDWPVCLLAADYARWAGLVAGYAAELGAAERERILGGTAAEAYGLDRGRPLQ